VIKKHTIATLGPNNTFSEIAAKKYALEKKQALEVKLFPTITKAVNAIGIESEYGIVPIENMLEGYVQIVLDLLFKADLQIIHEILLPVQFAFVANSRRLEEVEKLFVQFVTQGQCRKFINGLDDVQIITTQSNGESLNEILAVRENEGAIVPQHIITNGTRFSLVQNNVTDYQHNRTRFIVLSEKAMPKDPSLEYKTSLVIVSAKDESGVLSNILRTFADKGINLLSILSRPTKELLGKYHFFIDIDGHIEDELVKKALKEIEVDSIVKVLGSYPRAS
jgi:prephenate dehydratase